MKPYLVARAGMLYNKTSDNEAISILLRRWNKGTVRLADMTDVTWAVRYFHICYVDMFRIMYVGR